MRQEGMLGYYPFLPCYKDLSHTRQFPGKDPRDPRETVKDSYMCKGDGKGIRRAFLGSWRHQAGSSVLDGVKFQEDSEAGRKKLQQDDNSKKTPKKDRVNWDWWQYHDFEGDIDMDRVFSSVIWMIEMARDGLCRPILRFMKERRTIWVLDPRYVPMELGESSPTSELGDEDAWGKKSWVKAPAFVKRAAKHVRTKVKKVAKRVTKVVKKHAKRALKAVGGLARKALISTVSYTHLTLPTIYSV
eukprot:TRINITY_DN28229_c0_g1_i1.p1 TRINITY_DN28229_c0_g1~~TRINITY_DN28229_c0_g1_i1.p1  ORF type:complete len:244 (+),score=48.28 TRINITY_DN28229_c0_g1_i1:276-1007(+)